jgi:hypothetical protein
MNQENPLNKPKDAFTDVVNKLSAPDSPVGIDVVYTHAVIIDFLQQITARLDAIEKQLNAQQTGK